MHFLTLHVRLTRDCNAHCSYCSSAGMSAGRMSVAEFKRSIDFIADRVFTRIGVGKEHFLTVEFLGGEVLLVPQDELESCVAYARDRLGNMVRGYRDGAQSNLIGAPRRITALHDLFSGNLGTSWDRHSGQRHIKGSAELYNGILDRSLRVLQDERDHRPGRVIVVDAHTAPHLLDEVSAAIQDGYDLVLRPVFQGGSPDISALDPLDLAELMAKAYRLWSENPRVRIEPFSSLSHRRAQRGSAAPTGAAAAHRPDAAVLGRHGVRGRRGRGRRLRRAVRGPVRREGHGRRPQRTRHAVRASRVALRPSLREGPVPLQRLR